MTETKDDHSRRKARHNPQMRPAMEVTAEIVRSWFKNEESPYQPLPKIHLCKLLAGKINLSRQYIQSAEMNVFRHVISAIHAADKAARHMLPHLEALQSFHGNDPEPESQTAKASVDELLAAISKFRELHPPAVIQRAVRHVTRKDTLSEIASYCEIVMKDAGWKRFAVTDETSPAVQIIARAYNAASGENITAPTITKSLGKRRNQLIPKKRK